MANQLDLVRWIKEATGQLKYYRGEKADKTTGGEPEQ